MLAIYVPSLYLYRKGEMKCQNLTRGAIVVRTKKRSLGVGRNPIRHVAYVELQQLHTGRPFQFLKKLKTRTICSTARDRLLVRKSSAVLKSAARQLCKEIDDAILNEFVDAGYLNRLLND